MTKTEMAEQELADMGVRVVRCPGLHRKAIASADGVVGVGELADSCEARTVLEHEKQHYRLRAFYRADTDALDRRRIEARVHRALIRELCPAETLRALLRQGFSVSEIAEQLDVTEQLVREAYDFYCDQNPRAFG
jgi:hypothetical protein